MDIGKFFEAMESFDNMCNKRVFGSEVLSFDELMKLKSMLEEAKIPFDFDKHDTLGGYQISYPNRMSRDPNGPFRRCSVVLHNGSYGREQGLLEIMGLLTDEEAEFDDVVGYLTADNVFERISKDWEQLKPTYDILHSGGIIIN